MLVILFAVLLSQTPSVGEAQHKPPQNESSVPDKSQPAAKSPSIRDNPTAPPAKTEPPSQSKWWPPPAPWDIYWPTFGLVVLTGLTVRAALATLGAIQQQVAEMKSTGVQTDQLIKESVAQTKSLIEQSQSLAKSASHLGDSAAATYRSASAMEKVADKIAISAEAATASVSAINKQMRAYLCVIIGSALYQDKEKNIKFQAVPRIINAGLTPAHKVSFNAEIGVLPNPLPQDFDFPLLGEAKGTSVIGPRQEITVAPMLDGFCEESDVAKIKSGNQGLALYTWGRFSYEDIFGETHFTEFSQIYTWLPDGKTWGYYTDRHNEAS